MKIASRIPLKPSSARAALPRAALMLVAALVLGSVTSAVGAQDLPTPQALIARHDSLVGGRAALEAHQSMRVIGNFVLAAAGIDAPLEILKVRPNKYFFRTALGAAGDLLQGFDGTTAWAAAPGQPPAIITGARAESVAQQADFFAELHDLSKFSSLETVGQEVFEGRPTWKVKLTRPNGDIVYEYFDLSTGLSAGGATSVQGPTGRVESVAVLSDYKEFEGFRMATRIVQRQPEFDVVISIVTVEFDKVMEADVALPAGLRKPPVDSLAVPNLPMEGHQP